MIEYCHESEYWLDVTSELIGVKVSNLTFVPYKLRINGVVYDANTDEFKIAYDKAIFWSKLSD